MKKISKLQINSEKLMSDEELITLKGGYGGQGSAKCYAEGWGSGCMGAYVYINCPCWGCLDVCLALGGSCVVC